VSSDGFVAVGVLIENVVLQESEFCDVTILGLLLLDAVICTA